MRLTGFGVFVLAVFASAVTGGLGSAQAADNEYEIASNDGYGLQECLDSGNECGSVVADAWCEAHGHGHALSYGVRGATRVATSDETYVVKCGD